MALLQDIESMITAMEDGDDGEITAEQHLLRKQIDDELAHLGSTRGSGLTPTRMLSMFKMLTLIVTNLRSENLFLKSELKRVTTIQ